MRSKRKPALQISVTALAPNPKKSKALGFQGFRGPRRSILRPGERGRPPQLRPRIRNSEGFGFRV